MGLLGVCPWSEKLQKGTPKNIREGGWNYLPKNLSGPVSLEGACLFVCTLRGWQKPLRAGGDRLRNLEPKCLAVQGQGGRSFQMGKKARPMPSLSSTPTQTSHFPSSGDISLPCIPPHLPPTFFPFLTSYSMVNRPFYFCHPTGHPFHSPPPPHSSFVLFPAWSETPPALEFLPLLSDSEQRWRGLDAA